jgi:hypothetical protein
MVFKFYNDEMSPLPFPSFWVRTYGRNNIARRNIYKISMLSSLLPIGSPGCTLDSYWSIVRACKKWCGVAQLVARRLAVRQARVRFSARHHREGLPTELIRR